MTISRRQWLTRWLTGACALACLRPASALLALSGCGGKKKERDPILRVPVAEIPAEGRIERQHGRVAVELRREDGEIRARSLFCSHQLCRVQWQPEEQRYLCPCDDGLFAADGSVLWGEAKRPLRELDVEFVGDEVWIDTDQIYQAAKKPAR